MSVQCDLGFVQAGRICWNLLFYAKLMFMLNEPTVDRNVVILFDKQLTNEFIKLSQKISSKVPSKINLNASDEIPHLTLYLSRYPKRNVPKVIDAIFKVALSTKPFRLKLTQKSCHSSGTIFIDAEISPELFTLHEKLVDELNTFREGLYNDDEMKLPGRTKKIRKNLIEYGMWAVKQDYVPHVSVGRVGDPEKECNPALETLPNRVDYQTTVSQIAFVESGHDGTCKRILQNFSLER